MSSYYEKILATGEVKCIDEEIPFDIPQGWEWCRIGNIFWVTKLAGFEYTKFFTKDAITSTNAVPIVRAQNVRIGKFEENKNEAISITLSNQLERSSLIKRCLLMTFIGAGIGDVCIFPAYRRNHLAPNVAKIEPFNNDCFLEFFLMALMSPLGQLGVNSIKKSTAQPSLSMETIRQILIPIPPLSEQERIVDKIGLVMPIIDKYSKSQELLDKMNVELNECLKKSVLQEAIQGKLVPQIAEEGTAKELLELIKAEKQKLVKEGKLKKSALNDSVIFRGDDNKYWEKNGKNVVCIDEEIPFEIPNNWNWCRLKDIGKTETGTTPSKLHPEYFGNYIPFLSPANIFGSKIISETQGLSNIGVQFGRVVPKNSILQVCIGGSIGKCAIVNKPTTFNQQINSITPYFCNVEFVHIVLQSEYFRLAIIDKATGTATPIINRGNWETLLFPLPPLKEQQRIIEKYKGVTSIGRRMAQRVSVLMRIYLLIYRKVGLGYVWKLSLVLALLVEFMQRTGDKREYHSIEREKLANWLMMVLLITNYT